MFFIEENPKSILAERYRHLRTTIEYSAIDKELKSIVITSAQPSEGKSTVATSLAYVLASGGKKVIIIDCDLRKPSLHRKAGISNQVGLTDYLIGKARLGTVVETLKNGVHIVTSGDIPPNPAEVISSKAMINFINELKEIYDYILIDTPPISFVTDGVILASKADATILVVKAGVTKDTAVKKAYGELVKVSANVIGTVANAVDEKKDKYGYYGYADDPNSKKSKKDKKKKEKQEKLEEKKKEKEANKESEIKLEKEIETKINENVELIVETEEIKEVKEKIKQEVQEEAKIENQNV